LTKLRPKRFKGKEKELTAHRKMILYYKIW